MQQFWVEIGTWFATVVVSAGAVGGGFWLLLNKALDSRISQILERHKAELAEQLHMKNTVYTRVDEHRAVAVQTINALIRRHRWNLLEFSPKSSYKVGVERNSPRDDAMIWCLTMQEHARQTLQTVTEFSMLLPEDLEMKILAGWYRLANDLATELIAVFGAVSQSADFKTATESEQRALIRNAYDNAFPEHRNGLARVTNSILEDLRAIFLAQGLMPASSPIAPPDARLEKRQGGPAV